MLVPKVMLGVWRKVPESDAWSVLRTVPCRVRLWPRTGICRRKISSLQISTFAPANLFAVFNFTFKAGETRGVFALDNFAF